jgi:hypothetical protein
MFTFNGKGAGFLCLESKAWQLCFDGSPPLADSTGWLCTAWSFAMFLLFWVVIECELNLIEGLIVFLK